MGLHQKVRFALGLACLLCLPWQAFAQGLSEQDVINQYNRGLQLYEQGRYADAAALFERILPPAEVLFGKEGTNTLVLLNALGNAYWKLERFTQAEQMHLRCLRSREARLGRDHLNVAQSLVNLANVYDDQGRYAKAESLYQRSLQIYEARLGPDHLDMAEAVHNLAIVYWHTGQAAKAEALLRRGLQIREARLGKDHADVARSLLSLAVLYQDQRKYPRAEPLYQRSLQIFESQLGKDHPHVGLVLHQLANMYSELGQYARAEALYQRSLQVRRARLGANHSEYADTLYDLARTYHAQERYDQAEPLLRRVLSIYEAQLGRDHPRVLLPLNMLAALYQEQKQPAKAEPLLRRAEQICAARFGDDPIELAACLHNLALVYQDLGQPQQAGPLFRRSLQIAQARLGQKHPRVAQCQQNLAWFAAQQKDWATAIAYTGQARLRIAHHLAEVLPVLTEGEQLALLREEFARSFHRALTLGSAGRSDTAAASAEWLLNGQALTQQTLAEQQVLAREAREPRARQLVEDLQQTRARLAALVNRTPRPGLEAEYQQEIQALRAREQDMAEKLARAVGRPYRANPWVKLDELRARLGTKTAYVALARFPLMDFRTNQEKAAHYITWLTPPAGKGNVEVIDLGEAEPMDRLVAQCRRTLLESSEAVAKIGESEALALLQKPLQALSARVLHPLLPALGKYDEWVVCPDGALWLVPWHALLLPGGEFAVEKHQIRHVVSGRDLLPELPQVKTTAAYLFADPDYDLSPGKVPALPGELRGSAGVSLPGRRLRGVIDTWNVSFEFRGDQVLIRDEDGDGAVAGQGSWQLQGDTLTIRTGISLFQGTASAGTIRGERQKHNPDGSITRDPFRINLSGGDDEPRSVAALGVLARVPRLPGTAAEVEAVRPKLEHWLGVKPHVLLAAQASEAAVRDVQRPRVLTLATHGYFLPAQEVKAANQRAPDLDEGKRAATLFDVKGQPLVNPLLRCGLLLAGCNKRAEAKAGEDDGILTGLEILGLDLRGCELVVLSACETGLGEVRSGEGVAGLRQAFQLAGAKSVLASLWQVPDRETALLMNAFYSELAQGRRQVEALRNAQRQRLAARREQFGAAHPFFWAAFSLTSRGAD